MKRKRKGWLLIVTLLVVTVLLSGCGESVPAEGEQNVQPSNAQVVQTEKAEVPRFIAVEDGMIEKSTYTIFVDTTTRVMWIKVRDYEGHTYGDGLGLVFEPMIDSEGRPLLYEGDLTTQK